MKRLIYSTSLADFFKRKKKSHVKRGKIDTSECLIKRF